MQDAPIKIFVASSVYGFEDNLTQICATLKMYGYEIWNSHIKTVPVNPNLSNKDNCIKAVAECDCVFGIIREKYGSGVIGERSITHDEIKTAIDAKKPCWFIASHDIKVARLILKQYMYKEDGEPDPDFKYKETSVMDDIKILELYNETIKDNVPIEERKGHWVDEYVNMSDILTIIKTQFSDSNRVRKIVQEGVN
jgi:hypothetical protein